MNSTYWINKIMGTMFGGGVCDIYIGLSSTTPLEDGTGVTEPTGGGYARVRIESFTAPANGAIKNSGVILFPQSTSEWFPAAARATHWVLFDGAEETANMLASGSLASPLTVSIDTTVKVPSESICITLSDAVSS